MKKRLKCENCGRGFLRSAALVKQGIKKGYRSFCSMRCRNEHYAEHGRHENKMLAHTDSLSEFRKYVRKAIRANKDNPKRKVNIDAEYLKELWAQQNGRCAYTNIPLIHKKEKSLEPLDIINVASLDRIDSSKGYIKGNVQFVCIGANLAKNKASDAQMRQFIKTIKSN